MNYKYLLRLDDACPTMDKKKWDMMESILDQYDIKPLVGVIPNNEDPKQNIDQVDESFWKKVKNWENKDWAIALHGYNHVYSSKCAGVNPMWNKSEFAGLPLEEQKEKIRKGVAILGTHNIIPKVFFAPSHTYDENTLMALLSCSEIRIISDTIATKPYKDGDFIYVPQLGGHCIDIRFPGIWTFCFHPSTMGEKDFQKLTAFLSKKAHCFIPFSGIKLNCFKKKSFIDKILSFLYFTKRKISK